MEEEGLIDEYSELIKLLGASVLEDQRNAIVVEGNIVLIDINQLPASKEVILSALLDKLDLWDDYGYQTDLRKLGYSSDDIVGMKKAICIGCVSLAFFQDLKNEEGCLPNVTNHSTIEVSDWVSELAENSLLSFSLLAASSKGSKHWISRVHSEFLALKAILREFAETQGISPPSV